VAGIAGTRRRSLERIDDLGRPAAELAGAGVLVAVVRVKVPRDDRREAVLLRLLRDETNHLLRLLDLLVLPAVLIRRRVVVTIVAHVRKRLVVLRRAELCTEEIELLIVLERDGRLEHDAAEAGGG
jgi:hypothetical protein